MVYPISSLINLQKLYHYKFEVWSNRNTPKSCFGTLKNSGHIEHHRDQNLSKDNPRHEYNLLQWNTFKNSATLIANCCCSKVLWFPCQLNIEDPDCRIKHSLVFSEVATWKKNKYVNQHFPENQDKSPKSPRQNHDNMQKMTSTVMQINIEIIYNHRN